MSVGWKRPRNKKDNPVAIKCRTESLDAQSKRTGPRPFLVQDTCQPEQQQQQPE